MEWTILADLEGDIEPIKIFSFGALIQETKDTITIAQNYGINPEQVCSLMTIPKGCIKKITDIEEIVKP